jgi:uncharacterized protein YndB with AHSA1/START domain
MKEVSYEFIMRASPKILFKFLSTSMGLSEWFADEVNDTDDEFIFRWDSDVQKAKKIGYKENEFIRWRWLDNEIDTFLEFKIVIQELTGDVALIITDFVENGDEESNKMLWESQVQDLNRVMGS